MEQERAWSSEQTYETELQGALVRDDFSIRADHTVWRTPGEAVIRSDQFMVEWLIFSNAELQCARRGRQFRPAGRLSLLPPGVDLNCRWRGGRTHTVSCSFTDDAIADLGDLVVELSAIENDAMLDLRSPFVEAAMLKLAEEASSPGLDSDFMVRSLIGSICTEIRRLLTRPSAPVSTRGALSPRQINALRQILHDAEGKLPPLKELAAECGVAPRELSPLVKRTTGLTLRGYVAMERLNRARELLRDERLLIKQVAYSCGFATPAAFTAAFHKSSGVTPAQFRASC